jgi:hypothetical protein
LTTAAIALVCILVPLAVAIVGGGPAVRVLLFMPAGDRMSDRQHPGTAPVLDPPPGGGTTPGRAGSGR